MKDEILLLAALILLQGCAFYGHDIISAPRVGSANDVAQCAHEAWAKHISVGNSEIEVYPIADGEIIITKLDEKILNKASIHETKDTITAEFNSYSLIIGPDTYLSELEFCMIQQD